MNTAGADIDNLGDNAAFQQELEEQLQMTMVRNQNQKETTEGEIAAGGLPVMPAGGGGAENPYADNPYA